MSGPQFMLTEEQMNALIEEMQRTSEDDCDIELQQNDLTLEAAAYEYLGNELFDLAIQDIKSKYNIEEITHSAYDSNHDFYDLLEKRAPSCNTAGRLLEEIAETSHSIFSSIDYGQEDRDRINLEYEEAFHTTDLPQKTRMRLNQERER